MRKGIVELGIKLSVHEEKLELIMDRRLKEYEQEINRRIIELDRILTSAEVEVEENKIIQKCLEKFDFEVNGFWGRGVHACWENPPKKANKNYTFLERGKRKLHKKLTERKGKLWQVVTDNFAKMRSEFDVFVIRFDHNLSSQLLKVLPILPTSLQSFQSDYIKTVGQESSYQNINHFMNGMVADKLKQAFVRLTERNDEQLEIVKQKMVTVLVKHEREVARMILPQLGSAESYESKVKREMLAEMVVYGLKLSPSTSVETIITEQPSIGELPDPSPAAATVEEELKEKEEDFSDSFTLLAKDEDCFIALDCHYNGELSRQRNHFHEFLARRFLELNRQRNLADPLPLEPNLKTHVFLSHDWGLEGRNHWNVKRIGQALRERGLLVWLDDDRGDHGESGIVNEIDSCLAQAIDDSHVCLTFLTQHYLDKVNGSNKQDYCLREFHFACHRLTSDRIVPVVMEAALTDRTRCGNVVSFNLPSPLFHNFSSLFNASSSHDMEGDEDRHEFSRLIDQLVERIVNVMREYPRNKVSSKE